jgi:dienelactone hydrolase
MVLSRAAAGCIVLFAHVSGSGSGRLSPRNRYGARLLKAAGLATLLIDLLSPDEEEADQATAHLRFDVELLATRLITATDWLTVQPDTRALRIGYFGASTGAAAALLGRGRAAAASAEPLRHSIRRPAQRRGHRASDPFRQRCSSCPIRALAGQWRAGGRRSGMRRLR